jgi:hypothetical protein
VAAYANVPVPASVVQAVETFEGWAVAVGERVKAERAQQR